MKLALFDKDSTLITDESMDMLGDLKGKRKEVAEVTAAGMGGNLDFKESVYRRMKILKPSKKDFVKVAQKVEHSNGAVELISYLRENGYVIGMISGGYDQVAEKVASDLGMDFYISNRVIFDNNGEYHDVEFNVYNNKATLVNFLSSVFDADFVFAIGDGMNDLRMLQAADLGVVYNSQKLRDKLPNNAFIEHDLSKAIEIISSYNGFRVKSQPIRGLGILRNIVLDSESSVNFSVAYEALFQQPILSIGQDKTYL